MMPAKQSVTDFLARVRGGSVYNAGPGAELLRQAAQTGLELLACKAYL